jgi:hypothetical protein
MKMSTDPTKALINEIGETIEKITTLHTTVDDKVRFYLLCAGANLAKAQVDLRFARSAERDDCE